MKLYEYAPKKNTTRVSGLIIILISVAAALFLTPVIFQEIPFRGVFQMAGMIALIFVIYLIAGYMARNYVYALENGSEDGVDMTVTEVTNGKRGPLTVCRIDVSNITEAHFLSLEKAEDKAKVSELTSRAKKEGRKLFNYIHDMNASPVCVIFVEECGEALLLKISTDERFFELLKQFNTDL